MGTHAMVSLGSVVMRDVPAHGLVIGNPARQVGWVRECGRTLDDAFSCLGCRRAYRSTDGELAALSAPKPQ